VSFDEMKSYV
jgi:hypothetical protein